MKTNQKTLNESKMADALRMTESKTAFDKRIRILQGLCEQKRESRAGLMSDTETYELTRKMLERLQRIVPTLTHNNEIGGIELSVDAIKKIISYNPCSDDIPLFSSLGKALDVCLNNLEPDITLDKYAKTHVEDNIAWAFAWKTFLEDLNDATKEPLLLKTMSEIKEACLIYINYIQYLRYYVRNKSYIDLSPYEAAKELCERFNSLVTSKELFLETLNPSIPEENFLLISSELKNRVEFIKYIVSSQPIEHLCTHYAALTPELKTEFDIYYQKYHEIAIESILSLTTSSEQYQQIVRYLDGMCKIISDCNPSHPPDAKALFDSLNLTDSAPKVPRKKLNREETYLRIEKLIESIVAQNHFLVVFVNIASLFYPFDFHNRNLLLLTYKNFLESILPNILYPSSFNLEEINKHVDQIVEELKNFDVFMSLRELETLENINLNRNKLRVKPISLPESERNILDEFDLHYLNVKIWRKLECNFIINYDGSTKEKVTTAYKSYITLKKITHNVEDVIEKYDDSLEQATLFSEETRPTKDRAGAAAKRRARAKAKANIQHVSTLETQEILPIPNPGTIIAPQEVINQDNKSVEDRNEEVRQVGGAAVEVDQNGIVVSDTSEIRTTTPYFHLTEKVGSIFEQVSDHTQHETPKEMSSSRQSINSYFHKTPDGYYICVEPSVLERIEPVYRNKFYKAIANHHIKKLQGHQVFELYISGDPRILGKSHDLTTSKLKKYFDLKMFCEINGADNELNQIIREGKNVSVVIFDEYVAKHNAIDRCARLITKTGINYSAVLERVEQHDKGESKWDEGPHINRLTQSLTKPKNRAK